VRKGRCRKGNGSSFVGGAGSSEVLSGLGRKIRGTVPIRKEILTDFSARWH
jgi:hypothetical protein